MEVLPVPPNNAHVTAGLSHTINVNEAQDFVLNSFGTVMSNDYSLVRMKRYKDVNNLYAELSHPLNAITRATVKAMNFIVTGEFQPIKNYTMGKAKQIDVSEQPVNGLRYMVRVFH